MVCGHLSASRPVPLLIPVPLSTAPGLGSATTGTEISGPVTPAPPRLPQSLVRLDSSGSERAAFPHLEVPLPSMFSLLGYLPSPSPATLHNFRRTHHGDFCHQCSLQCNLRMQCLFPVKPPIRHSSSPQSEFFCPFEVSWDFAPILALLTPSLCVFTE